MSTRDEFEAVIWRHWPARGPDAGRAVDAIIAAAGIYATALYDSAATAVRRAELAIAVAPVVHWQHPGRAPGMTACGRHTPAPVVPGRDRVSCASCMASRAWQEAA